MVGSLSFFSSTHCRAACSSRENPGRASSNTRAAAVAEEEEEGDATDDLEPMGLDRSTRSDTHTQEGDDTKQQSLLLV